MKKKYIKPEILFESYELNTSIATCFWDLNVNNTSKDTCAASSENEGGQPDLLLFVDTNKVCNLSPEDYNAANEDYCYENGTASNNVFNS